MSCRHCNEVNLLPFLDLGHAPPSNSYLSESELSTEQDVYPLIIDVCPKCWLVQTRDFASREIFFSKDYAYFSSFSSSWLAHAKEYMADMRKRFQLDQKCQIVEIAANDGYLLQYAQELKIPCYGVEPTASTARAAREKGIEIIENFFDEQLGKKLAANGPHADLMVANNVLAHVPDINDFIKGFVALLKPNGVATFEFPHLYEMLKHNQFDTVYHEHYSYLSLLSIKRIFQANGLSIFDVEALPFHGGSLRVFAQRSDVNHHQVERSVGELLKLELDNGLASYAAYEGFQAKAIKVVDDFKNYLIICKSEGLKVAAFGAAAKGNTLLNFAQIGPELITMVADNNPAKQGQYMPGNLVPIVSLEELLKFKPDRVIILPWNIKSEIKELFSSISNWDGKFITAVPMLSIDT